MKCDRFLVIGNGAFIALLLVILSSCASNEEKKLPLTDIESGADTLQVVFGAAPIDSVYYSALLTGTLDITKDSSFVMLPEAITTKPIYLNAEAAVSLVNMVNAAKADQITLMVLSGYRSFQDQKSIWTRKWNDRQISDDAERSKNIMLFSAMPKTSRHHWGTDVDLNSLDNKYFGSGEGQTEHQWLCKNAQRYGFRCVYTDKSTTKRMGYETEKWHWSYMPLAEKYLKLYNQLIAYEDINEFPGSQSAKKCRVIEDYVNGVNAQ